MRACAMGLRTTAIHTMPGRTRSSRKWPCPVTRRSSSLRSIREPMYRPISTEVSVSVPTACSSAAALPGSGPWAMVHPPQAPAGPAMVPAALWMALTMLVSPEALPQEVDDDQTRLTSASRGTPFTVQAIHPQGPPPPSLRLDRYAGAASGEPARHDERLAGG